MFSAAVNNGFLKFVFIVIIIGFLWIHIEFEPFLVHDANKLEVILLRCIILVIILQIISTMDVVLKHGLFLF